MHFNQSINTCRAELMVPPTWPSHISIMRHRHYSHRWKIKHPWKKNSTLYISLLSIAIGNLLSIQHEQWKWIFRWKQRTRGKYFMPQSQKKRKWLFYTHRLTCMINHRLQLAKKQEKRLNENWTFYRRSQWRWQCFFPVDNLRAQYILL